MAGLFSGAADLAADLAAGRAAGFEDDRATAGTERDAGRDELLLRRATVAAGAAGRVASRPSSLKKVISCCSSRD